MKPNQEALEARQGKLKLTLGGKVRTLFFDYFFLALLREHFGSEAVFSETVGADLLFLPIELAFIALKAGADENELPDDFSKPMLMKWMRELSAADLQQIILTYRHSMGFMSLAVQPVLDAAAEVQAAAEQTKAAKSKGAK